MKYFYRILILITVFIGSVWYMGRNMKEEKFTLRTAVEMEQATFPTMNIVLGGTTINTLQGYSGNLNVNSFRESMVPLPTSQSFTVQIIENETVVKKVMYELIDITTNEVLDSATISALEKSDNKKIAKITLKAELENNKEYSLKLTAVTDTSKKISYITRVKLLEKSYLSEKLAFVEEFHQATLDKTAFENYKVYLNPRKLTSENSTLNKVNIESGVDLVSWSVLQPKVVQEYSPTIKEIDQDTMSVELSYVVEANQMDEEGLVVEGQNCRYYVKEFYRVRYSKDKMWLLYFERNLEQVFDFSKVDVTKGEIALGVSNEEFINMMSTEDNNTICFAKNGTLWYYDLENNNVVKVFSFMEDELEYYRDGYNQHDIRILKVDETGNVDFMVYGYMNRGDYEGRLGLVVYKYYREGNRIEEQVFIPLQEPFEVIREKLDGFSYLSDLDVFYFSVNNSIYSYSVTNQMLTVIASNISRDSYMLSDQGQFIAWQNSSDIMKSNEIMIRNLETEENYRINAQSEDVLKILGVFNQYLIYGYAHLDDVEAEKSSSEIIPIYRVAIADSKGEIVKEYEPTEYYVTKIQVKDNVIELNRVQKTVSGYIEVDKDYIINRIVESKKKITSESRNIANLLVEQYIRLPEEYSATKAPDITSTLQTIITKDATVHFEQYEESELSYYVYGVGRLLDSYNNAAEAIKMADMKMGVVIDSKNHIVWERGIRPSSSMVSSLTPIYVGDGLDSVGASLTMLLKYNQTSVSVEQVMDGQLSMYAILEEYLDGTAVNLTGSTLQQVLYYTSKKRPIIAMRSSSEAVLIIGYDESSITFIDPLAGTTTKLGITAATEMFQAAGNIFMSYVK